jgi:hypothetical protein
MEINALKEVRYESESEKIAAHGDGDARAFALSVAFVPNAHAGCGNTPASVGAVNANLLSPGKSKSSAPHFRTTACGFRHRRLWEIELVAKNLPDTPPEGVVIDHGYTQWHSDGTEIMNSSRPPATGNFCLGVWRKTGPATYSLTHRVLSFNPDGTPEGPGSLHEVVVLERGGNTFSGTFTFDQFDTLGNLKIHIEGVVRATRILPE